jgi:cytolysin-activating lysine-acyltransferase
MANEEQFHIKLSTAMLLMNKSSARKFWPIARVCEWIRPPVLLDQIVFFRDSIGPEIGYMTWAYLTQDTERRFINDPDAPLHLSEWNEGDRLWIMDMVVTNDSTKRYILQALRELLPSHGSAKSLRRFSDGSVRKLVMWRRRHGLKSAPQLGELDEHAD